MKLTVFTPDASSSSEKEFSIPEFEGSKGLQALKEVIVAINANNRQGTRSTKTRGEVSGGGKKPWRQKGTGRARHGSTRSPIWVGGGVAHGPRPQDFSKKINSKVRALAFSRALFDRAAEGELVVIEEFVTAPAKTKVATEIISRIAPKGRVLLVDAPFAETTVLAARNIARVSFQEAAKLNPHDLAQYAKIVVSAKALDAILARANGGNN